MASGFLEICRRLFYVPRAACDSISSINPIFEYFFFKESVMSSAASVPPPTTSSNFTQEMEALQAESRQESLVEMQTSLAINRNNAAAGAANNVGHAG